MGSICQELKDAKADPDIKVIILRGEGGSFSAGANVKNVAEGKLVSWNMKDFLWDHLQRVPLVLEDVDNPLSPTLMVRHTGVALTLPSPATLESPLNAPPSVPHS